MATYTITINERTKEGRSLVEYLKGLNLIKSEEPKSKPALRKETENFLHHAKISASENFSKYL